MEIKKTNDIITKICVLISGQSGVGKTTLAGTLTGKTLIISAEAGLLPLKNMQIDYVEIEGTDLQKYAQLKTVFTELKKVDYENIFIDSISEISEIILAYADSEFPDIKNTMQKWALYTAAMKSMVRYLRDLDKNIFLVSLQKVEKDETNRRYFLPDIFGQMASKMPAYLDLVLSLRIITKEDEDVRVLQTFTDNSHICKDRSGLLNKFEKPDLQLILNKIQEKGEVHAKESNNNSDTSNGARKTNESSAKVQSIKK